MNNNQSNEQKRVVIYTRVAASEQADKKCKQQAAELTATAKRLGYEPVAVYSDKCSGRIRPSERPKLCELMQQVKDTKPTAILVADYSNISRVMEHTFEFYMWTMLHRLELIVDPLLKKGGVR